MDASIFYTIIRISCIHHQTVREHALYFGSQNFQPKTSVHNPDEYVEAFIAFIEQKKEEAKKAEEITPEELKKATAFHYRSSVDDKLHPVNDKNWMYHSFAGKKENYQAVVEQALITLEGFGKVAREMGDNQTFDLVENALRKLK